MYTCEGKYGNGLSTCASQELKSNGISHCLEYLIGLEYLIFTQVLETLSNTIYLYRVRPFPQGKGTFWKCTSCNGLVKGIKKREKREGPINFASQSWLYQ